MKHTLITALLASASLSAHAQTCLTASQYPDEWADSRYTVNAAAGTVLDTQSNLMWMRCSLGQTLTSPTCAGAATTYNWNAALAQPIATNNTGFAGFNDWRLPNIKELASIAALNCDSPAINETIFPATVALSYWSASPYADNANDAWQVNFFDGPDIAGSRTINRRVRLVRTGP